MEIITISEAAEFLGISYDAALNLTKTGRFRARKRRPGLPGAAGQWNIERPSVLEYKASLRVYREPTVAEAAWAAGFIDGEGCLCVGITRSPRQNGEVTVSHQPHLLVANTHRGSLEFLSDLFGGNVHERNRASLLWSTCWNWLVCSQQAERVLRATFPYLIVKREQARLMLELCERLRTHREQGARRVSEEEMLWRDSIRDQISALNGRGSTKKKRVSER